VSWPPRGLLKVGIPDDRFYLLFADVRVAGTYLVSSFIGRDCGTDRYMLLVKFGGGGDLRRVRQGRGK